jgi:hypothetical protein
MKRKIPCFLLLVSMLLVYACKKDIQPTQICLHDSSMPYLKRWANTYIQTNVYASDKSLQKSIITFSHGYFQLNIDYTYNLYSDGAPVNGKWGINDSCEFVLNPHTNTERRFSVIQLSADSLTIRQKVGNVVLTEHYASFACPDLASLQYRWDNVTTLEASYKGNSVFNTRYLFPVGYFKLNTDASYNVLSNGSAYSGTWGISQPGCLLVLDKNKPQERSFDVQKLTADSLVIWRKDTVTKVNYLQYYKKHK